MVDKTPDDFPEITDFWDALCSVYSAKGTGCIVPAMAGTMEDYDAIETASGSSGAETTRRNSLLTDLASKVEALRTHYQQAQNDLQQHVELVREILSRDQSK